MNSFTTKLLALLAVIVLLTDLTLLALLLEQKGKQYDLEEQQKEMDDNLQEMFDTYGTTSFFGTDSKDIKEFLSSEEDLFCEEDGTCCGGNSVGFYTCFYPDDIK